MDFDFNAMRGPPTSDRLIRFGIWSGLAAALLPAMYLYTSFKANQPSLTPIGAAQAQGFATQAAKLKSYLKYSKYAAAAAAVLLLSGGGLKAVGK